MTLSHAACGLIRNAKYVGIADDETSKHKLFGFIAAIRYEERAAAAWSESEFRLGGVNHPEKVVGFWFVEMWPNYISYHLSPPDINFKVMNCETLLCSWYQSGVSGI